MRACVSISLFPSSASPSLRQQFACLQFSLTAPSLWALASDDGDDGDGYGDNAAESKTHYQLRFPPFVYKFTIHKFIYANEWNHQPTSQHSVVPTILLLSPFPTSSTASFYLEVEITMEFIQILLPLDSSQFRISRARNFLLEQNIIHLKCTSVYVDKHVSTCTFQRVEKLLPTLGIPSQTHANIFWYERHLWHFKYNFHTLTISSVEYHQTPHALIISNNWTFRHKLQTYRAEIPFCSTLQKSLHVTRTNIPSL